jgi:hypothetical protein
MNIEDIQHLIEFGKAFHKKHDETKLCACEVLEKIYLFPLLDRKKYLCKTENCGGYIP